MHDRKPSSSLVLISTSAAHLHRERIVFPVHVECFINIKIHKHGADGHTYLHLAILCVI